jgi:hypothetical protein
MSKIFPIIPIKSENIHNIVITSSENNNDINTEKKLSINTNLQISDLHKRKTNTPSPPPSPMVYITPPPPSPLFMEDNMHCIKINNLTETNNNQNNLQNSLQNSIILLDEMITNIKKTEKINLRYDRLNVHDYIYNYILFAYNFYNPIFTMYITIITYKQLTFINSIFKNIVVSYAIIYPLIAMLILLNEAYNIYCKKFIYYKMMDNGVIFKWKKEQLHKSFYFWWYILSLIFIIIGLNDSWNVIIIFINQTSNLCLYIYNSINIESTLITLNGFFENNIMLQTENIKKIIWIDENRLKENVFSMIEAKNIINNNINNEINLLLSSLKTEDDFTKTDDSKIILENFDKYKKLLNTKKIVEYYRILQKINIDMDIIGKINIERNHNNNQEYFCEYPYYKRNWVLTLINEIKQNNNIYWNHKCSNCNILKDSDYYLCLLCRSYLCDNCNTLNSNKSLKFCYNSPDMDHKTINIYNNVRSIKDNKIEYPWYYKLYYHYVMDNNQIISILDAIYYLSIVSILIIEIYGFYIIFN